MKKLLLIFTILFSVLFSFSSLAEWKFVVENKSGDEYFVEDSSIKQRNGYVYYWVMLNFLKPNKHGTLSIKSL